MFIVKMMIVSLTMISAEAMAKSGSIEQKLRQLHDMTNLLAASEAASGGTGEEKMRAIIATTKVQKVFVFKVAYRHIAGRLKNGNAIPAGSVFVVNPSQTCGVLWWKKPCYQIIKEPLWTQFKVDRKPLPEVTLTALKKLLKRTR